MVPHPVSQGWDSLSNAHVLVPHSSAVRNSAHLPLAPLTRIAYNTRRYVGATADAASGAEGRLQTQLT
jgi:hypothetical protein